MKTGAVGVALASRLSYFLWSSMPDEELLAYALGRSLLLSDEPTIELMQTKLTESAYRFTPLVEVIVTSPQFLNKRSLDFLRTER